MKTSEQLLQMLANVTVTYLEAGGHSKADRNEAAIVYYKKELEDRGAAIPNEAYLLEVGKFNGEGAK